MREINPLQENQSMTDSENSLRTLKFEPEQSTDMESISAVDDFSTARILTSRRYTRTSASQYVGLIMCMTISLTAVLQHASLDLRGRVQQECPSGKKEICLANQIALLE
jgi:hypothetical protein